MDQDTVRVTLAELRTLRQAGILGRLTSYHRALYRIVCDRPGLSAGDVRRELGVATGALSLPPLAERTVRKYLNGDLARLRLVRFERSGPRGNVLRCWPTEEGGGISG